MLHMWHPSCCSSYKPVISNEWRKDRMVITTNFHSSLHDCIISLRGGGANKTSLTPPHFIEVSIARQDVDWSCICVLEVSVASVSAVFLLYFGFVTTVWYFFPFLLALQSFDYERKDYSTKPSCALIYFTPNKKLLIERSYFKMSFTCKKLDIIHTRDI